MLTGSMGSHVCPLAKFANILTFELPDLLLIWPGYLLNIQSKVKIAILTFCGSTLILVNQPQMFRV